MELVALVVVAAAVMAAAWALHPSWVRGRAARAAAPVDATSVDAPPADATAVAGAVEPAMEPAPEPALVGAPLQRFFAHFHVGHRNGNGNGHDGNGHDDHGLVGDGAEADRGTPLEEVLAESPIVTPAARGDIDYEGSYLEGFDLRSVARFAVRFFACVLAAMIVATFALWAVASLLGLVGAFERFMRGIGFTDFTFLSIKFLLGICLIGAAISLFLVVMTLLTAGLYNVLAHRWQGVRVFISDGRRPTSSAPVMDMDGSAVAPPARNRRVLARGGHRVRPDSVDL